MVDQNRTCSIKWAAKQEKFPLMEACFFLTSSLENNQNLSGLTTQDHQSRPGLACQKYDLVFIIGLQSVFAQGFEIAFQDLPTTAVPTRSGQGTGTMPKGSKNSSTALRTPG